MMKLFQIYDTTERKVVPDLFFENKQVAKTKRRELNKKTEDGEEILRFVVTPGPQHRAYKP